MDNLTSKQALIEKFQAAAEGRLDTLLFKSDFAEVVSLLRAADEPVELPCDKCGRGVDEHVGAGMPCPTGDYRDSLYGLLVRHGWSQHEAHATAYDGGMPVRAGSIPALWVLDDNGYIAAWYTYDPIAAGKKVGTGKLIPLYSRPPEPPRAAPWLSWAEQICREADEYLNRSPGEAIHSGSYFHREFKRALSPETKPAAPWCSLCQGEHEPCNPDEWHRKTRELNQLAAETDAARRARILDAAAATGNVDHYTAVVQSMIDEDERGPESETDGN